jgi:hypothetical protein
MGYRNEDAHSGTGGWKSNSERNYDRLNGGQQYFQFGTRNRVRFENCSFQVLSFKINDLWISQLIRK